MKTKSLSRSFSIACIKMKNMSTSHGEFFSKVSAKSQLRTKMFMFFLVDGK